MQPILQNNIETLHQLFLSHKVKKAYAFGSVCTDRFNDQSDIDVLVYFNDGLDPVEYGEQYFDLAEQLEKLFNRPVDLMTDKSLKNPYFIQSLNKTKVTLYE